MAIFHFSAQMISRGAGRSAVAAAAYRAGDRLHDAHTGLDHDYTRRSDVREAVIITPDEAPAWAQERQSLWDAVNAAEKRGDAQTAREIEVSLPRELTPDQQLALVVGYVQRTFAAQGMVADIGLHEGHNPKVPNPHAHILLTTRPLTPEGFGPKERRWNRKDQLVTWRQEWAAAVNQALDKAGHLERIDARSFQDQGIVDREPTIHEGVAARAMERRGIQTERVQHNRTIQEYNAIVIDLAAVRAERDALAAEDEARERVPAWEDIQKIFQDPDVRRWLHVAPEHREAQFMWTFNQEWRNEAQQSLADLHRTVETTTQRVNSVASQVQRGQQATMQLQTYTGLKGLVAQRRDFPEGKHWNREGGYEETFKAWQQRMRQLVEHGAQAAQALDNVQRQATMAATALADAKKRLPVERAAQWQRISGKLMRADQLRDRVAQRAQQLIQHNAPQKGGWARNPQDAQKFRDRVADRAIQQMQTAVPTAGDGPPPGQSLIDTLKTALERVIGEDQRAAQRLDRATDHDLEQALLNPWLDLAQKLQIEAVLNRQKQQELER